MSEDRTQTPSKQRIQQARERGQVAHSPELTGAVGLLAAVALLGACGESVSAALISLMRDPLVGSPPLSSDPAELVGRLRQLAFGMLGPLGVVLAGFSVAATAMHQVQVGGLWVPGLFAPDPARLWAVGRGPGLASRGARGAWTVAKAIVVVAVTAWGIRSGWLGFQRLGDLEIPAMARESGRALQRLGLQLAAAILVLGLIDWMLQARRFEILLRMTPEEQREDQKSMEGDPALRARRRRIAKAWRGDASEILAGASLIVTGPGGLTLVLAGGPPPRRVSVRSTAHGPSGFHLRRSAESAKLPAVVAPDLARRLARRLTPALPLPPEALAELAAIWPQEPRTEETR